MTAFRQAEANPVGRTRRRTRRQWLSGVAGALVASPALARPVRVGRFVSIPFGVSRNHGWPTEGGGGQRAFRTSSLVPQDAPTRRWATRSGASAGYTPILLESGAVIVTRREGISGFDTDGQMRWTAEVAPALAPPSVLPDGSLVASLRNGELIFFRQTRIVARVRGVTSSSPLVLDDGTVVVRFRDGKVSRVDSTGRVLYSEQVVQGRSGGMLSTDGRTILLAGRDELVRVAYDGNVLSRLPLGSPIVLGPGIARDGSAWLFTRDGVGRVISPSGQEAVRVTPSARPAFSSSVAVAADGSIRYGAGAAGLVSLDSAGRERWRIDSEGVIAGRVSVDGRGTCLASTRNGDVIAVDTDGNIRWRINVGGRCRAEPIVGRNGKIIVLPINGSLQHWQVAPEPA